MFYMILILIIIIIVLLIFLSAYRKWYYYYYLKNKLFPLQISDIKLEDDITKEANYNKIIQILPRKPTNNEIIFLLKYKKFMDLPNVYSMCDNYKINQMKSIIEQVFKRNIPGLFVETGVWKGGMAMWMKCIMKYHNQNRNLWLFDTFDNFPEPTHTKDKMIHNITNLLFSKSPTVYDVIENFKKFGLLDDKVHFIVGDFSKTLKHTNPGEIAILRLDSDYYDSTLLVLELYYHKVVLGGYIIIDDYNNHHVACKNAVDYFRKKHKIESPIHDINRESVYWIK
ncbi:macrocin O-methyl transferase [Megavirus courdo7]|uniref:Macrocin O-methyl transferase n=1 Tax=Megavirus courdo7 TaxID=1128135 RepID=H2E9K6_9VIRU|nr:macrocin O-methyl transferase [Megavirus courdo7]